jgi:hypothetical protein
MADQNAGGDHKMTLGFTMIGMAIGFASVVLLLIMGAGFVTAFLTYAACGSMGILLAILGSATSHKQGRQPAPSM